MDPRPKLKLVEPGRPPRYVHPRKSSERSAETYLDPVYVAGFFDGEGTLGIYSSANGRCTVKPVVAVSGQYRPTLELMQAQYGGSLYISRRRGHDDSNQRADCWRWQIHRQASILSFLNDVLSHLREKRVQAEIMVAALTGKMDSRDAGRELQRLKFPDDI